MRYPDQLIDLARAVLRDYEEDWMPGGAAWDAVVKTFAEERLEGAIGDCVYDWQVMMECEKAEGAMAAAEGMAVR